MSQKKKKTKTVIKEHKTKLEDLWILSIENNKKQEFLNILQTYQEQIREWETKIHGPELCGKSFKINLHKLKGTARQMGSHALGDLAEDLESRVDNQRTFHEEDRLFLIETLARTNEDIETWLERIASTQSKGIR